jgi:regulator of protease activity HflC (stomatin/prohibitin superfamily)
VVTGDANLLHHRWALRYTVADPYAFRFGFADTEALLRAELDRAVVHVSARYAVDRALRTDLESYRAEVDRVVRARLDDCNSACACRGWTSWPSRPRPRWRPLSMP